MGRIGSLQILGIDVLRFCAAAMVCAFHLTYWGNVPEGTTAAALRGAASFPELGLVARSGWVGVEVFFVISGFVIAYTARGKTGFEFFKSRFFRLVPAAWICATITVTLGLVTELFTPTFALRAYLGSVVFYPRPPWVDGVYWTLAVEISFYSLTWLLIVSRRFAYFNELVSVVGVISALAAFLCVLCPFEFYFSRTFELLLIRHGSSFALGAIIWLMVFDRDTWIRRAIALISLAGSMCEIALTSGGNRGAAFLPVAIFLGSMAFLLVAIRINEALASMLSDKAKAAIRSIGLATYPLYLLHNVIGATSIRLLVESGFPDWLALSGALTIVLTLSFAVCLLAEPWLRAAINALFMRRLASFALRA